MEMVQFATYDKHKPQEVDAAIEIWRSAGFKVEVCANCDQMIWRKLLLNITVSAACCLTGLTVGEMLAQPDVWPLARACLLETVAVAAAKGIDLQLGDPVAHVSRLANKIPGARPSMLLDHLAGRRSEIEQINGAVVREGANLSVPTPVNAALAALVKGREASFH
jgi:2-dehydropantoate 2-reductase